MNVVHVAFRAEEYGIGTMLHSLVKIQKETVRVAVAFHADGPRLESFRELGVPVYCLGHQSARNVSALIRFYGIFLPFDVVNLHTYSPHAFLAAKMAGKKVVFTSHGSLGLRNAWTDTLLRRYYRLIMYRWCDMFTFASSASLERFADVLGREPSKEKFRVFPYGIDLGSVAAAADRRTVRRSMDLEGKFVIGCAARIAPEKRIDRLIGAFGMLPPDDRCVLLVMGAGDASVLDELKKKAAGAGAGDRVRFTGFRPDVLDIMAALDMFVMPSRNEPFGLALLEAMTLGVPSAVFSDGGGAVDILGDSGPVVEDAAELREAILRIREDEYYRDALGSMARERARMFDIRFAADNLYRIYCSLLGTRREEVGGGNPDHERTGPCAG